jgi:hypothetical protein
MEAKYGGLEVSDAKRLKTVNRLGFMSIPSLVMDSTHFWRKFRGSGVMKKRPATRGRTRVMGQRA